MFRASLIWATAIAVALTATVAVAKDPAPSWLVYAEALCPKGQSITKMTGEWTVGPVGQCAEYFTPWFGIESFDNLDLLQPVNPWNFSSWTFYPERFAWPQSSGSWSSSGGNQQPNNLPTTLPGHRLLGRVERLRKQERNGTWEYNISITDLTTASTSSMVVDAELDHKTGKAKHYPRAYVVYEHQAPCNCYPASQAISFEHISIWCDGSLLKHPKWITGSVNPICDFAAHVVSSTEIRITWNTSASQAVARK